MNSLLIGKNATKIPIIRENSRLIPDLVSLLMPPLMKVGFRGMPGILLEWEPSALVEPLLCLARRPDQAELGKVDAEAMTPP